jgi:BNR repeat protein
MAIMIFSINNIGLGNRRDWMKRSTIIIIGILLLTLFVGTAWSAWVFERLTDNSGEPYEPSVAVVGDNVDVVWDDNSYSNYEIFNKRSTDGGVSWTFSRLTTNTGGSYEPSLAATGSNLHLVWRDLTYGNDEIFYRRSTNSGSSWDFERLTNNSGRSQQPEVAVSGSTVHVVWNDDVYNINNNCEILYKRSTNNGSSWSFQRLSTNSGWSKQPAVAAEESTVHVAWSDNSYGNNEIFYKRSTDNGTSWSFQRITANSGYSSGPALSVSGDNVHLVWTDSTYGGNAEIFYKRSTDCGSTWSFQRLTDNTGASQSPAVAATLSDVHVVWIDNAYDSNFEIFYKGSTDNGTSWNFQRLSDNSGMSHYPAIAVSRGVVHVMWSDYSYGDAEIFYKRGP